MKEKIFLLCCVLFAALTVNTAAEIVDSGTCGDNLTWTLDITAQTLTISGVGAMKSYSPTGSPWHNSISSIANVVIENGVTTIGNNALRNCSSLINIMIPSSLVEIGGGSFYGSNNLLDVYYGGSEIQWYAISIGAWNNPLASATIHYAISGPTVTPTPIPSGSGICGENLTWNLNQGTLTISGTGNMTDYNYGSEPWNKNRADIHRAIIENGVTTIGASAFYFCSNLTSVAIPETVTTIGEHAFLGCSSLANVVLPESVITIGASAFAQCESLENITIPSDIISINAETFQHCTNLVSITISDRITAIGSYAFGNCPKLTNIYYKGAKEQWSEISVDFYTNPVLRHVMIYYNYSDNSSRPTVTPTPIAYGTRGNITWSIDSGGILTLSGTGATSNESESELLIPWHDHRLKIYNAIIENGITRVGWNTFYACDFLKNVVIPFSVTSIAPYAFFDCGNLEKMTIPLNVTSIGGCAFNGCANLANITIPAKIDTIGNSAFYQCSRLADVYYGGTKEQWDMISIGVGNEPLLSATIHYNSAGPESAPVAAPGTVQTVSTSDNAYAAALDYSAANLNAGTAYRILYGLYDANGQLQSIRAREITFDDTFRAELMIDGAENGLDCKIFLSGVDKFAPQCETAKILFRE